MTLDGVLLRPVLTAERGKRPGIAIPGIERLNLLHTQSGTPLGGRHRGLDGR